MPDIILLCFFKPRVEKRKVKLIRVEWHHVVAAKLNNSPKYTWVYFGLLYEVVQTYPEYILASKS